MLGAFSFFVVILLVLTTGCTSSGTDSSAVETTKSTTTSPLATAEPPDVERRLTGAVFGVDARVVRTPEAPARPDPEFDNITWTLPTGAPSLRLSMPADIGDIFYSEKTGVGGFGLHAGGHPEGLDHVWIEIKKGVPVRSWADGVVTDVSLQGMVGEGEYHITIDYGENLAGIHMEIETAYVKVGDKVERGQEVGLGMSFDGEVTSAEMSLIDYGRTDGVIYDHRRGGVYVSPYDYLEKSEKRKLVDAYKEYVLEPYEKTGNTENIFNMFEPYQPYLTNRLFLHEGREGKLSGEWYFTGKWEPKYPNDIITFIVAEEPYYETNIVLAHDDEDEGGVRDYGIRRGKLEVDYEKGRLKITKEHGSVYYGIFEIDESEDRAKLLIEYREGDYPPSFSSNALTYIERSNVGRREDAVNLGMRDTY